MKIFNRLLIFAWAFMATTTHATDKLSLASPDGQMQMTFMLTNQGADWN